MLRLCFYDPSDSTNIDPENSEGDEDKVFYNHVGDCNFKIDKVLSSLLVEDRFDTVKNIVQADDMGVTAGIEESLESEEFLTQLEREVAEKKRGPSLLQTKGKVDISFEVHMSEEFRERTKGIVKQRVTTLQKKSNDMNRGITTLAENIEQAVSKYFIIKNRRSPRTEVRAGARTNHSGRDGRKLGVFALDSWYWPLNYGYTAPSTHPRIRRRTAEHRHGY